MIEKVVDDIDAAIADIHDGATVMIGGFGRAGQPVDLIDALNRHGATELTIVSNNAGNGDVGLAALLAAGKVRKIICSFPRQNDSWVFDGLYRAGQIELELVPQGNLIERIRAAGAGIPAFYSPTGVGTLLYDQAETRHFGGRDYVLLEALPADFALVQGYRADRLGNVQYRKTARNFGPSMAAAATTTIVQVDEVVPVGALDPESIPTPGIFVDRIVPVGWRAWTPGGEFVGGIVDVSGEPVVAGIDPHEGHTKATEHKPSGTEGRH
jgi:3-oxoadipate CoA-transferase alpha subunit